MGYQLRDYQFDACSATWDFLRRGHDSGNPVVVMPTGSGKSVVIAEIARRAVQEFSGRVMVLAHRAELLRQNAEKIQALLPFGVTCGIFSAGLRKYSLDDHVVCAGIQSVYKKAAEFGRRHLVVIDEGHLVPDENTGMYRRFIDELGAINPRLRVVGLTATPFRTTSGSICGPERLFTSVCFEARIPKLISDGFLCPITTKPTAAIYDTAGLHIRGGEFIPGEVEKLFDDATKIDPACREIVEKTRDRHSVLVFCSGVQHAEHVAKSIESMTGERVGCVTGGSMQLEREAVLSAFRAGRLRFLTNVDVLTTGYDAPCIDAIAVLRATMSPGLFAQICGRGFRPHESKADCLILDYGDNIKRHGPLDAENYGQKPKREIAIAGTGAPGEGKKQCPSCNSWVANATKICPGPDEGEGCGWLFTNHVETADQHSQILAKPQKWIVTGYELSRHKKKRTADANAPDTLKCTYFVDPIEGGGNLAEEAISEWVCLEHPPGWASVKADDWWRKRTHAPLPADEAKSIDAMRFPPDDDIPATRPIDAALSLWRRGALAQPLTITTMKDSKFYRVVSAEFDELPETWADTEETNDDGIPF